jgi:hypothetical protein
MTSISPISISNHPIDPSVLLTYLRQSLDARDPLYSRVPAILDVFAIFHQLSEALIREADRAIQAQAALLLANRKAGIKDSAIVKYGGLSAGYGKVLMRIKGRWEGDDRMAVWSLNIRKYVCRIVIFVREAELDGHRGGVYQVSHGDVDREGSLIW